MKELPTITIASCANEAFAPGLLMAVLSSFYSSSDRYSYHYYILDGGLSEITKSELRKKLDIISSRHKKQYALDFLVPSEQAVSQLPRSEEMAQNQPGRVSSWLAFARLMLQNMIQGDFAIYIDSDVLCVGGLHHYYEAWDHKAALVAVQDPMKYLKKDRPKGLPKLSPKHPYFNSGMVLMNLTWFREYLSMAKVVEFLHTHPPDQIKFHDQTIMNNVLNGDFILIDKINNLVLSVDYAAELGECWKRSNLHYIGRSKPWGETHHTSPTRILADYIYWRAAEFYGISGIKEPKVNGVGKIKAKAFWYNLVKPKRALVYKKHYQMHDNFEQYRSEVDMHFNAEPKI